MTTEPNGQSITVPEATMVPIGQVQPYYRNPRRIPQEAIDAVAESIHLYGYQQPIVVDQQMVVVVGHTRLLALKKLGFTEVPVLVTDLPEDKVREYRLIDNKTSEMTSWDTHALVLELREFEQSLLDQFFPDVNLEIEALKQHAVTQDDIDRAQQAAKTIKEAPLHAVVTVECPSCFHQFQVRASALPGISMEDEALLAVAQERAEA